MSDFLFVLTTSPNFYWKMCLRPLTPAEGQNRVAEANQLRDRVQDGATPAEREAGLTGIVQFVEAVGRPAEPFVVPLMPAILKALSEKVCVCGLSVVGEQTSRAPTNRATVGGVERGGKHVWCINGHACNL